MDRQALHWLERNAKGVEAFSNAIISLPKLKKFDFSGLVHSARLGALICRPAMRILGLSLFGLTASESFFSALARKEVNLSYLLVRDEYYPFDDVNGHGDFARKLSAALETNHSLQSLVFKSRYDQMPDPTDDLPALLRSQQTIGNILGVALARHPAMKELELHFKFHRVFFRHILAGLSSGQQLESLKLTSFEGTSEQRVSLLNFLKNSQVQQLVIEGLREGERLVACIS